ncbi:single-stranded DNA-binding protein [Leptolyngbya boryana NIES-2135]|jgi:single-strand DNA-binding protein|uniref:Single-stranded DNA-binding protein n=1 Tax=Leptolyngbya boryana NIES-2135 TaxID=1973484 RepID=A0A1Z4JDI5_LEPBY|nr:MULTISPECIES: single-stranded DNA-binding protein [Leptolyngbya]BAY54770.1 single-stranded DNA-binding protein [Leptolyngbya boryana NIES-2135]MBD2365753.1 single-stranded DNA-binding protein [Leptolyngbya sp. FACHB-161]MBD2371933.1 single-stranded DNA-binding protein [Leptolyngbya sp. FACHB-238]MBD2396358.1 single-stranded DNA-binding protein [Leptolyngbya sp. FACHB-239]MBD2402880.1 single-stranded DNA-binding protein [Leptolyngbya sp. FACHB-402]
MNSIILLADIVQEPQLRYTSDNQTAIAEMRIEFSGLRPEDPPTKLKAVGWGNLAQEIQANYHEGDRVILEGRLTMNTVDRPEGFKEKQAELTIQKIYALNGASLSSSVTAAAPVATPSAPAPVASAAPKRAAKAPAAPALESQPELDDIPF